MSCFGFTKLCSARQPAPANTAVVPQLCFVNGISSAGKSTTCRELVKAFPPGTAEHLASSMKFFPGDPVPVRTRYPNTRDRARALTKVARKTAEKEHKVVVVDFNDYWHQYLNDAALVLKGREMPTTAVLLYITVEDIVKRTIKRNTENAGQALGRGGEQIRGFWNSLVEYGLMFRGTRQRTPNSLEYLSRERLNGVLDSAGQAEMLDSSDTMMMYSMVQKFLARVLQLDGAADGVWIEPRWEYDVVINTSQHLPPVVAEIVHRHMDDTLRLKRPSVLLAGKQQMTTRALEEAGDWAYHGPYCQYCYNAIKKACIELHQDASARQQLELPPCASCLDSYANFLLDPKSIPVTPDMSAFAHDTRADAPHGGV